MLPYMGYPTQPHDHLHDGAPHDDGLYDFLAAPFSGENAGGTHAHYVQASPFGYDAPPQQYAGHSPHDLWSGSAAALPTDGSLPVYDSPTADYTSLDQHYAGWQEGPHGARRDSLFDPQFHHDHALPVPAIARIQCADFGFHGLHDSHPVPYPIQPGFPVQPPLVARLELSAPMPGRRIPYGFTSPTESTYSELRHALTESPVSPSGSHDIERASCSPFVVEDLPPAFPRPTHSPSSELSHALDEFQIGRAPAPARVPSPMMAGSPAEIESPPSPAARQPSPTATVERPESPPMRPLTPPSPQDHPHTRNQPRRAAAQSQDGVRLKSASVSAPLASAFLFVQDGVYPFRQRARKKSKLACFFCRGRKIACGPPPPGSKDPSCNRCVRHNLPCKYPTASRRRQYKRRAALVEQERCDDKDCHDHDHDHDNQPGASTSRG